MKKRGPESEISRQVVIRVVCCLISLWKGAVTGPIGVGQSFLFLFFPYTAQIVFTRNSVPITVELDSSLFSRDVRISLEDQKGYKRKPGILNFYLGLFLLCLECGDS